MTLCTHIRILEEQDGEVTNAELLDISAVGPGHVFGRDGDELHIQGEGIEKHLCS